MRAISLTVCMMAFLAGCPAMAQLAAQESGSPSLLNNISRIQQLLGDVKTAGFEGEQATESARLALTLAKRHAPDSIIAKAESYLGLCLEDSQPDSALMLIARGRSRYMELNQCDRLSDTYRYTALVMERTNAFDSAMTYFQLALKTAEECNYAAGIADAYYGMGRISNIRGQNTEALTYSEMAASGYRNIGMRQELGQAVNQLGVIYDYLGMYAEAMTHYLEARDIAQELGDLEDQILIANNLGVIYLNLGDNKEALKYYNEALEKSGISNDYSNQALLLNNISYLYLATADTLQAIQYLWQSIRIFRSLNESCTDIYPMEGLGAIYLETGDYDSAKYYLDLTLAGAEACEDAGVLAAVHKQLGRWYAIKKQHVNAKAHFAKAQQLSESAHLTRDLQEALLAQYNYYKSREMSDEALRFLEKYQQVRDSIADSRDTEKVTKLISEYQFRKQLNDLEDNRRREEIRLQEEIRARTVTYRYILLAAILLLLLLATMIRSYVLIQRHNKKLKWLNEEKNTLLGMVAHDLRNPLGIISGLVQILKDSNKEMEKEDMMQYLEMIESSSDRMRDMIDRVLDLSALENMKLKMNPQKVNLNDLLLKAAANFELVASQKQITIFKEIDETKGHWCILDPNYFNQVLDNLVSNAIKFSPHGESVHIMLWQEADEYVIGVKDHGPGLTSEDLGKLFGKFAPLSSKPTGHEKSMGLGLSIVKKFVDAMNGKILCESEPGKGATFILRFKML